MGKRPFKVALWPTLGLLIGLAILLSLGSWQALRFHSKYLEEELRDEMSTMPTIDVHSIDELSSEDLDFRRVVLHGQFDHRYTVLIKHRIYQGEPGYWVVTPYVLERGDGAVLVNRGWLPFRKGEQLALTLDMQQFDRVSGLVHRLEYVVPDNTNRQLVAQHDLKELDKITQWESYDITGIQSALPYSTPERPIIVTIGEDAVSATYPKASYDHITQPYLTAEKHFGYALTWYTLAIALVGIYLAHGFGVLRAAALK